MKLAGMGIYTFEVEKFATKPEIAKVISELFKVSVVDVRTLNTKGKVKWQKKARRSYTLPTVKKAIVTLKKGQTIPLFESPKEIDQEEATVTRAEDSTVIKERKGLLGLGRTKVKIEKGAPGAAPTTQRKVITGK